MCTMQRRRKKSEGKEYVLSATTLCIFPSLGRSVGFFYSVLHNTKKYLDWTWLSKYSLVYVVLDIERFEKL